LWSARANAHKHRLKDREVIEYKSTFNDFSAKKSEPLRLSGSPISDGSKTFAANYQEKFA